jgi:hypothetical protein
MSALRPSGGRRSLALLLIVSVASFFSLAGPTHLPGRSIKTALFTAFVL